MASRGRTLVEVTAPRPLIEVTIPRPEDLQRLVRVAGEGPHLGQPIFKGMVAGSKKAAAKSFFVSCPFIT